MEDFKMPSISIRVRDLTRIYSGSFNVLKYRTSKQFPKKYSITLKDKDENLNPHVLKSSDFVKRKSCHLPRVSVFQIRSRDEIDRIVSRLAEPTMASRGISLRSEKAMRDDMEKNHLKYLGLQKIASEKEQEILSNRIARDTHSTYLRKFLTNLK